MKLPYITLLAVALVVGCSKPAPSGTVASNTPTANDSTSGNAGPSTNQSAPNTATPGSTPAGSPTGSTPPSATPGKASPPATAPGTSPSTGATPSPGATPPAGTAAVPGGQAAPPQLTPAQQAEMEKRRAAAIKQMKENGAKAEAASRATISGVSGNYTGFIDETKITAQMRKIPNFDQKLAQAKEDVKKATVTVAANGDVVVKGMAPMALTGFTCKIDGKPAFVFTLPKPQPGMPQKQFINVVVKDSGNIIVVGPASFKKN